MANLLPPHIADRIVDHARSNGLPKGAHLGAQALADLFNVSRIPVRAALVLLAEEGLVFSERNRGFFLAMEGADLPERKGRSPETTTPWDDPLYYQLAEDWLSGRLGERVSENELMRHYAVTRHRLLKVLQRAAEDLWVERLPGHGWHFLAVMVSPQAYEDGYRFRLVIEPAALLEPSFRIDPAALASLSEQQISLLKGGFRKLSQTELFSLNSQFHEVLVGFSNNPFFIDAVKKIDRVRRLLDFRSTYTSSRDRLLKQCSEHLEIIDLLEKGDNKGASEFLRQHIQGALESKRTLIAKAPPVN
ncbi:GntR family transcriptional regulator [Propionivibrio dicarboxylicus]|uniref:DNA-binding transcriptional regulator, GntR family n=1 Tax=Propionivibrio dicarboxylicus TaxID=83767 RepID=A0A1G8J3M4_9RHOO|nr:GntR family transcriptional regulator [Propionivibrio dicarboxylicus]SDI25796.1 DNA-binding transcriptional regulator, GntR family [Propionivibrio dicarboxylicus]